MKPLTSVLILKNVCVHVGACVWNSRKGLRLLLYAACIPSLY